MALRKKGRFPMARYYKIELFCWSGLTCAVRPLLRLCAPCAFDNPDGFFERKTAYGAVNRALMIGGPSIWSTMPNGHNIFVTIFNMFPYLGLQFSVFSFRIEKSGGVVPRRGRKWEEGR